MKIYVGNLSFDITEEELQEEFAAFGEVESVTIPTERYSSGSRGFAFVEMSSISEGQAAIDGLSGKTLKDRTPMVSTASARTEGRGGGSYKDWRSGRGRWRRY